jgi:hypothetical protein
MFTGCRAEDFKCRDSGHCIPSLLKCNGVSDCAYSSDEENCKIIKAREFFLDFQVSWFELVPLLGSN